MKLPDIETSDGRRAWAFAAMVGGCVIFTAFAAVGVYLVRSDANYSFLLALAAHGQVLVGMTGLAALLIKRSVKISKDGAEITDMEKDV